MAPSALLDAEYITAARYRAMRFCGAWTGTSGTLAADVMHLLKERATMTQTIEELESANAALRNAVETRLAGGQYEGSGCCDGGKCHSPPVATEERLPVDWILQGERALLEESQRPLGMGILNATPDAANESEQLLLDALAAVRDRRGKYGPPAQHFAVTVALVNAAFGTTFTPADWAVVMILDKIARSRGPGMTRDNWVDCAGYAACRTECEAP